ncbi:hypothetical protein OROGR_021020 [Orobanche gracilis]
MLFTSKDRENDLCSRLGTTCGPIDAAFSPQFHGKSGFVIKKEGRSAVTNTSVIL